jgi:hypothetical protein
MNMPGKFTHQKNSSMTMKNNETLLQSFDVAVLEAQLTMANVYTVVNRDSRSKHFYELFLCSSAPFACHGKKDSVPSQNMCKASLEFTSTLIYQTNLPYYSPY